MQMPTTTARQTVSFPSVLSQSSSFSASPAGHSLNLPLIGAHVGCPARGSLLTSTRRGQYSSILRPSRIHGHLFCATTAVEVGTQVEDLPYINKKKKKKDAAELTLELLEWPRVLHIVSSFAGTESAKEIIQDFTLPSTELDSENLLSQTTAAIDLLAVLGNSLDFGGVQSKMVNSCLIRLQKGFLINGREAVAIATLLKFTDTIQRDIKMGGEQNIDFNNVLKFFLDTICTIGAQPEVTKAIWKIVDEDGNVKDSASSDLQRARVQHRMLETKVQELLRSMLREQEGNASTQKVDGRFCIAVSSENQKMFPGLLLQSGSGGSTSYIEPLALVSLNDKLAEARASILKAEYEALQTLTKKLLPHLENLAAVLETVVQLDVVIARAKFSLMYEGSRPTFTAANGKLSRAWSSGELNKGNTLLADVRPGKGLLLQLRQAYHPLLLHQYREHVRKIKTHRRKRETTMNLSPPVPIDVSVPRETRVVTITGPNTGGKTAAMKTLGLAALMAKSGLYVLAKDPVYLPWFDAVFADIGDEQSLFQSLSTFSGHLRRINHIKESSTGESLVLLDEVGTGTNPIEGAALGMSILESFARDGAGGAQLTFASTHHAELKTLKYSDNRFENASVEFDEETLKPTYRLLWGIPGRSNALNISERLGVPKHILGAAWRHLGAASTEINQVIMDLERSKREFENDLFEAEQYLKKAKLLHKSLKEAAELMEEEEQSSFLVASSMLQEEAHKARAALSTIHLKKLNTVENTSPTNTQPPGKLVALNSQGGVRMPKVGEMVYVPRLGKEAKVVQVLSGKKMVVVQSGSIQLRLSLSDVK